MHVAGAIAEQVGGAPWNTLFTNKIINPLGLKNTTFCLKANNPRIAGGICTSPVDIMKFASVWHWQSSVVIGLRYQ